MQALDRGFQAWRIAKVRPYIPRGARVLDIGCGDGALFRHLKGWIAEGVGIDSDLKESVTGEAYRLIKGHFPDEPDATTRPFDVITMMAVLEHVPPADQARVARRCASLLAPSGRLLITVPSPAVDRILHVLKHVPWLYEGRSLEQHYGFQPSQTPAIFHQLTLRVAKRFQGGLNNLFVFEQRAA